jgi:hypothetical protein
LAIQVKYLLPNQQGFMIFTNFYAKVGTGIKKRSGRPERFEGLN